MGKNVLIIDLGDVSQPLMNLTTAERTILEDLLDNINVDFENDDDERIYLTFTPKELSTFLLQVIRKYKIIRLI
jgi:hypothetical protein